MRSNAGSRKARWDKEDIVSCDFDSVVMLSRWSDDYGKENCRIKLNQSFFSRKYSPLTAVCILSAHLNAIMKSSPNYVTPKNIQNQKISALPQLRPGPLPKQ